MKFKRILPICLLAGSLLLSSCDDLLNNFGGGKKNKDDDTSDLVGYQGKQGATELSKAEWEKAFSLEEFALRRNCHVDVSQSTMAISLDVDNGKFKVVEPGSSYEVYIKFDGVDADKNISGTAYSLGANGTYVSHPDKEPLDLTMAEFGIIYLDYDSFTYNSSSKMYTSNKYHYEVEHQGEKAIDIDCYNCEVTIEDGFPKKLECDVDLGMDGDQQMLVHYVASYSKYNAITVDLPNTGNNNNGSSNNNGGNNGLPAINGKEINFSQFKSAYQAKATPNYNTAVLTITINDGATMNQTVTVSATKVNGKWVMDDANYESIDLETMLLTDEMMAELETEVSDPQYDIHFYQKSNGYVIAMSQQYVADSETGKMETIDVQLHVDQYFYTTAEYISSGGVYESIDIQWRA